MSNECIIAKENSKQTPFITKKPKFSEMNDEDKKKYFTKLYKQRKQLKLEKEENECKLPKEECKVFTLPKTTPICGTENKKSAEVPKNIVFMSTDIRLKKRDNMFQQTSDLSCLEEDNLQTQEPPRPIQPKRHLQSFPQHPLSKAGVEAPTVPVDNSSPPLIIKDFRRQKSSNSTETEFMLVSKGVKQVKPKEIIKDFEDYNKFTELEIEDNEDNEDQSFENLCLFKSNQKEKKLNKNKEQVYKLNTMF